jgi:hypothetical protein
MAEVPIFDAGLGDGKQWADKALEGKHKGPLSVGDAQVNLGLVPHPSLFESGYDRATIRATNFRVSAGYARAIALSIANSPAITALEFSSAGLDAAALAIVVAAVPGSAVRRLHVDFNGGDLDAGTLSALVSLPIDALSLRGNGLGPTGAALIAERLISDCPALASLSLFRNNLGDDGCRAVLRALRFNRSLRHLSLGGNCAGVGLLNDALSTLTRYTMDAEGADQRGQIIEARANGRDADAGGAKKKKKKGKDKGSGGDGGSAALDAIISGGVPAPVAEGEEGEGMMLAQAGTICCGTRTIVTLDISGNPDMGSSARASESAVAAFTESETAVDDMAAGGLSALRMECCGLSEDVVARVAATIRKATTKRTATEE